MKNYKIMKTKKFNKQLEKIPLDIKKRFEKQLERVAEDPYNIGKPLGFKWFRELKNNMYRLYYLIYEEEVVVLLVGVSNKRMQQEYINKIRYKLKSLRKK